MTTVIDEKQLKTIQEWSKDFKKIHLEDYATYIYHEQMKYMEQWITSKVSTLIPDFTFKTSPDQQYILENRFTIKKSFMPLDGKMFEHHTLIDKQQAGAEIGWFAIYVDYVENKIHFKGE
jgi:hypothetical protein